MADGENIVTSRWIAFLALTFLGVNSYGSVEINIPCPIDDTAIKYGLWQQPEHQSEIAADRAFIWQIEDTLRAQSEADLIGTFGPVQLINEKEFVLPSARHTGVGFSGMNYKGAMKSYFLPIGDIGGMLVFPLGDGSFVSSVAIYLKVDQKFVPLRKASSYFKRRTWDLDRLKQLEDFIKQKSKEPN